MRPVCLKGLPEVFGYCEKPCKRLSLLANAWALSLALLGHMRVAADTRMRKTRRADAESAFRELP